MDYIRVSENLLINSANIKAVREYVDGSSEIFIDLEPGQSSIISKIPFQEMVSLLEKDKSHDAGSISMARNLDQMARYQQLRIV